MGEERELLIALSANRTKAASQRELAIAYWGLDEVAKHWDTETWMRARIRYKLEVARGIEQRRQGGGGPGAAAPTEAAHAG